MPRPHSRESNADVQDVRNTRSHSYIPTAGCGRPLRSREAGDGFGGRVRDGRKRIVKTPSLASAFSCRPSQRRSKKARRLPAATRPTRPCLIPPTARCRRQPRQGTPTANTVEGPRTVLPTCASPPSFARRGAIGGLLGARDGQAPAFPGAARGCVSLADSQTGALSACIGTEHDPWEGTVHYLSGEQGRRSHSEAVGHPPRMPLSSLYGLQDTRDALYGNRSVPSGRPRPRLCHDVYEGRGAHRRCRPLRDGGSE